jgi:hypothetical protein
VIELIVGLLGTAPGVILLLLALGTLEPDALFAVTVKVYAVPLDNPVITTGDAAPDAVMLPGLDFTVYPVTAALPLDTGAVKVTDACALPVVADTPVGIHGAAVGAITILVLLLLLIPLPFVAVTVNM